MAVPEPQSAPPVHALLQRLGVPIVFLVLCIAYFLDIADVQADAAAYPRALIGIIVLLLVLTGVRELRTWRAERAASGEADADIGSQEAVPVDRRTLMRARITTVIAHLALILLIPTVGASLTSAGFVGLLTFSLGERRPHVLVVLALVTGLTVKYVFIGFLGVPLPETLLR